MTTQNIYEYKKVKPIDKEETMSDIREWKSFTSHNRAIITLINKINELVIEQNHIMKDFELYKKAFKKHVDENKEPLLASNHGPYEHLE